MGWAIGVDHVRQRIFGYGVPALCDYPTCDEKIDRGLSYACGGGVLGSVDNCGMFFCPSHLDYLDPDGNTWVCERCGNDEPSFPQKEELPEWAHHLVTHESWTRWREQNPEWYQRMKDLT